MGLGGPDELRSKIEAPRTNRAMIGSSADPVPRLQQQNLRATGSQAPRRDQARQAAANHHDIGDVLGRALPGCLPKSRLRRQRYCSRPSQDRPAP